LNLWYLPLGEGSGDRKPIRFLQTQYSVGQGQISPDGHWMAYSSDVAGQLDVYVRPFPAGEGEWRISRTGAQQPRWRGDGKELFFVGADGKMIAVEVRPMPGPKPGFDWGTLVPLFDTHIASTTFTSAFQYDVTKNGKRFLIAVAGNNVSGSTHPPLNVVVNWNAGLKE